MLQFSFTIYKNQKQIKMEQLNLKLPIKITPTNNNGYVIKDSEESEYFFYTDKENGKLIYDGCCVTVENKEIVFEHIKQHGTMKQTAVEWLFEQIQKEKYIEDIDFEQAKEMEKQQIIDAWLNSLTKGDYNSAEEYYNETFKQQEQ